MRTTALVLLLLALAPAAHGETATQPHAAWVTSDHGLNVRREAGPQSEIVAVLWKGARVFVRDNTGPAGPTGSTGSTASYVRIDGYGVAGYAYVDAAFIGDQPPQTLESPGQHPSSAPAAGH